MSYLGVRSAAITDEVKILSNDLYCTNTQARGGWSWWHLCYHCCDHLIIGTADYRWGKGDVKARRG